MALDTRGFMDGALKGFSVVNQYQNQQDAKARTARLDEQNNERYADGQERNARLDQQSNDRYNEESSLRQAKAEQENKAFEFEYGVDGKTGYKQQQADQASALNQARLTQANSTTKLNNEKFAWTKKQGEQEEYRRLRGENIHLTEQKWNESISGKVDESFFDQDWIKGTEQDIRTWDDAKIKSLEHATDALGYLSENPQGLQGYEKKIGKALGAVYQPLFDKAIGARDAETGKIIKSFTYERYDYASDINPDLPGDQPGITIIGLVTYEGDSKDTKPVEKPVTNNRSTDPKDNVKVIPIESIMKDLSQRSKMARIAVTSQQGSKVFGRTGEDTDYIQKKQLKYLDKSSELAKAKQKAIDGIYDPTPDKIAEVEARYAKEEESLQNSFFSDKSTRGDFGKSAINWAQGDYDRQQYLSVLVSKGYKLGELGADIIDKGYKALKNQIEGQTQQVEADKSAAAQAMIDKITAEAAAYKPATGPGSGLTNAQHNVGQNRINQRDTISKPTAPSTEPVMTSSRRERRDAQNQTGLGASDNAAAPVNHQMRPDLIRPDGTQKGSGFLGVLKNANGESVTEYSVGVNIDGKEIDIPTLIPTLTKEEIQIVLAASVNREPLPRGIIDKAVKFAQERMAKGESQYAISGDL